MPEQASLFVFERDDLSRPTGAELEASATCRRQGVGVREFARRTESRPGTIGDLLARASEKTDYTSRANVTRTHSR